MSSLWLENAPRPSSDSFPPGSSWDEIVVGAGLTGLATAVLLARAGRRVLVLEAGRTGGLTTGHTTGKVSLLQGSRLMSVARSHGRRIARAYVDGNRAGQQWVLDYCADHGVAVERRDAWSYAGTPAGRHLLEREFALARDLGLPVAWSDPEELPYRTFGAVRLADQSQLDPLPLTLALVGELRRRGGRLVEDHRVENVRRDRHRVVVSTAAGTASADHVVLASGVPFLDRGLYFAKVQPQRTYAAAFRVPGPIPQGMYLSVDLPDRSLRSVTQDGSHHLVVVGNSHPGGRPPRPSSQLMADLVRWTTDRFPGAEPSHRWAAQDYRSANSVPFVGRLPRGGGRIFLATGYDKWGLTNAPMAALMIAGEILGERPDRDGSRSWVGPLHTRITRPPALLAGLGFNATAGLSAALGWATAEAAGAITVVPEEGHGVVGAEQGRPVGVSTTDGVTCAVSAICSHLGGVVTWNDLERSWDCPLHGSRFAADGSVLEGPAGRPLRKVLRRLTPP